MNLKYEKVSENSYQINENNYNELNTHSISENFTLIQSSIPNSPDKKFEYLTLLNKEKQISKINKSKIEKNRKSSSDSDFQTLIKSKQYSDVISSFGLDDNSLKLKSNNKITEKQIGLGLIIDNVIKYQLTDEEGQEKGCDEESAVANEEENQESFINEPETFKTKSETSQDNNDNNLNKTAFTKQNATHLTQMNESLYVNDDIMREIRIKENDKINSVKRRQSMVIKRSLSQKIYSHSNKLEQINSSASLLGLIEKSEKNTEYGKNKRYIKYIDCIIAFAVCMNISISIIDNELYLQYTDVFMKNYTDYHNITEINSTVLEAISLRTITPTENTLRSFNVIVVTLNLFFIYLHYIFKIRLLQADQKLSEHDNIFTSGLYKFLFIEIFICAFFYPPFLNTVISGSMLDLIYTYNLNSIISFIVTLKCYIILRVYSYFSRWTSDMANSVCMKYKVRGGIHFAIKAEFKNRPYSMLIIMAVVSLTFCAFGVRIFEYGIRDPSDDSLQFEDENHDLQSLTNCFWLTIVTMTTVGYGDYSPKSNFGRLITMISCIIGMLLVSLFVVSLAVVSEFTNEEKKAYCIIKKIQADDTTLNKACVVIRYLLRLRVLMTNQIKSPVSIGKNVNKNLKKPNKLSQRFVIITQLKTAISTFKNNYKLAHSYNLPIDEMLKRLENKLKIDINKLNNNLKQVEIVYDHLNSVSTCQENLQEKLYNIMDRQKNISEYILDLNNKNYKFKILNLMNKKLKCTKRKRSSLLINQIVRNSKFSEKSTMINSDKEKIIRKFYLEVDREDNEEFSKSSKYTAVSPIKIVIKSSENIVKPIYNSDSESKLRLESIDYKDKEAINLVEVEKINSDDSYNSDFSPQYNLNNIYFDNQEGL